MSEAEATHAARPKLFVGVGASAGGIGACKKLLAAVPPRSGVTFILVLHLDPTRGSHIAEILRTDAKHVKVTQVEGTSRLEPDHAYVIAPNSKLHLEGGILKVDPLGEDEPRGRLVDYLFASLADAEHSRAAGVVLSGAGYDGTEGLGRIRAAGGLTLVQDPETAGTDSMPRSAIRAGAVDAVLPAEAIPAALAEFADRGTRPAARKPAQEPENEDEDYSEDGEPVSGFARILEQLGERADVGFDDYKVGTLERRTRRRMNLKGIGDWDEYAAHMADHPEELEALYHDVLIGVTEFFRDLEVWSRLSAELPALLERREAPGVRAWVPGCGTGEEAYSLAMLLSDNLPGKERSKIQLYATDLNEPALGIARRGVYAPEAFENVPEERRERYFNQHDGQLRIDRSLRDCVTFAPHNVLSDAPLSKMDIVTCRNLLIYLRPQAHDRLLRRLHFALRPGGLLVLGRAEKLGRQSGLFDEVSERHSIFRSRPAEPQHRFQVRPRQRERARVGEQAPAAQAQTSRRAPAPPQSAHARDTGPERRIEQFVLRERTPATVVVNSGLEIRHFYGRTDRYLVPPPGQSRQDLLAWVRPGFYIRLRSVLKQAVERGESLTTEGEIDRDGTTLRVECTVEPIAKAVGADEALFLVSFRDLAESGAGKSDRTEAQEPLVRELEQELADTRRELRGTMDQLESAGEEYHASNEELQSLNEELQSSNEELEASKEELEALNEEMNTVNTELEQKNTELREANADLNNLFLSTGVPTVFLNRRLEIRRFTSAATKVMRLVQSDVGRSIEHVKERYTDGQTAERSRRVLETLEPDDAEVVTEAGRSYVRNILPYRMDDEVEGVCITFMDVTEQKRAVQASEAARAYAESVIETVRTPVLVLDAELLIISANRAFRRMFGASEDLVGQPLTEARNRRWNVPKLDDVLERLLAEGEDVNDFEVVKGGREVLINARRIARAEDPDRLVLSFEDVTEHREAQRRSESRATELREDARRKDQWIAMLGHELRNPIGAIGNGVELMRSEKLDPQARARTVTMMRRQVNHVAALLDNLLDAARIVSGKLEIEREAVDLSELGEWAVDTVAKLAEDKRQELKVMLPPRGSICVRGDRLRLTEVVGNLLTNAVKYTEPEGEITLSIAAEEESAVIRVRDTGIGIPSGFEEEIFEIFTQGRRSQVPSECGLGLGLPLVRTLVQLHGGEVEVFSAGDGQGSEFKVTLPLLAHEGGEPSGPAEENAPVDGRARRILIVDDEPDVVQSLAALLQTLGGHETRVAATGPDALAAAKEFAPDAALLDISLPDMDGYELARRLRVLDPNLVLIAVTGYQRDASRLEAAGFDHHLIKPIDMSRLAGLLAGG